MTALADPPHLRNARNSNAASVGSTGGGWILSSSVSGHSGRTRHEALSSFEDCRFARAFQERFWLGASALIRESEMADSVTDLLAACRAMPANDPVDIERCVSSYRGKHRAMRVRYFRRRLAVWSLTGGRCLYCRRLVDFFGCSAFRVDHVIPRAAGGTDDLGNLVPACDACNAAKGALSLEEWRAVS